MSTILHERVSLSHTLCFMFSGKAGVGKTFCSDLLQKISEEEFGLKTCKAPFARGVKDTARFMGWGGQKNRKGRILLQRIGAAGREYDIDLWAKGCFNYIDESPGYPYDIVFIDDWRFKNELEYVQSNQLLYKAVPIRIEAPDREILKGTPEAIDQSEIELDKFTFAYTIFNSEDDIQNLTDSLTRMLTYQIKQYNIH
jgi:hypothetical protein